MKPFDPHLLRLAPGARAGILGLGLLGTISGLAAIAQAFAVAHLVFVVVRAQPLGPAVSWALGAFAVRGLTQAATEVVAARTGVAVSSELRRRLADQVLAGGLQPAHAGGAHAAGGRVGRESTAPLTLMTQGATAVEPYVARYLPSLVAAAVLPLAAIVAMATLDPLTALIPVLTLPLLPVFAALIGMATRDATDRRWRALSQLSGHFLDVMKGLPTLVGYSRAHRQTESIRKVSEDHREATVATLRLAFLSSAALEFLATIAVAIVAVSTGLMLATGRMELEIALTLILLAPEAYWPVRRVGAEFHNAADGAAALEEIASVLDPARTGLSTGADTTPSARTGVSTGVDATSAPDVAALQPGRRETVTVRGLSFRYAPDLPDVIRGLDVEIGPGLTMLVGPSGAGKTTLLELLAGLRTPTEGQLEAPRAHLVTQRPFLAPVSMRDNLLLGAAGSPSDEELRAVLGRVDLAGLLADLPAGLDTPLGDDGFGLSAGQRARFALARALLSDAPLVLLDEPTAHLDPETERHVAALIRELADTRTVVAVAHRPLLGELADAHIEIGTRGGAR